MTAQLLPFRALGTLTSVLLGLLLLIAPAVQAAPFAYISNFSANTVSVIDTATNTVTATVAVGTGPEGVAVSPDGARVYVGNFVSDNVSVISTASNTVTATVAVGTSPFGVAVTPDGARVYVANSGSNNVSVISTASNTVTATVTVGASPVAFGLFIGPAAAPPPPPPASIGPIPTLSEWAVIMLAGLVGFWGVIRLRRRMV